MIAWANVLRWDPAPLNKAAGELNTQYEKLLGSAEELRASGIPRGWVGGASDAAREKNWRLRDEAELWAAEIAAVRRATGDVADAMAGVVEGREEALSLAQRRNFIITEDGEVVDNLLPLCLNVSPAEQAEIEAERARIAEELEFRVSELQRQAADIDHDYCLVLDRVLSGHIIDAENNAEYTTLSSAGATGTKLGMLSVLTPPPPDATAAQNAAYWASLSDRQQAWMARTYPERIGGRNGIDAKHRSIANRILLDRAQARFKDRIAELRAENSANPGPGGRSTRLPNQREIWDLQHKVEALDALERLTEDADGDPLPDKQLLVLDASGDEVHGAVANGNVDTADHVAAFTPGMNSDIGENFAGYVADMQDVRYLAEKQLNVYGHGGSVATVT